MEENEEKISFVDRITVDDFKKMAHGTLEVKSAYNGKVLCKNYEPKKHKDIGERVITSIWSEIRATKCEGFYNSARPIICVFVLGDKEYEEELRKKKFCSKGVII